MQYRVAVAYQNTAWEKGTTELTKLFSTVKQEECLRRINLREFLVAFVQRQQRVFLSLPGIHNTVLEDLVDKKMTKEDIEKLIEATIENQASNYKKSADTASSGSAPSSKGADNILDVHLESPLSSDLTCKAKVIQRKSSATSGWKTSLAIMTVDSYLHLFDIENAEPEISPEDAFQSIIPNVIMPDSQNVLMGKANFSKGWSDSLTPSDSLILGNCKILSLDSTTFELTETVASTGASRMLGKSVVKKVLFRTLTKEEADDWITVLLS